MCDFRTVSGKILKTVDSVFQVVFHTMNQMDSWLCKLFSLKLGGGERWKMQAVVSSSKLQVDFIFAVTNVVMVMMVVMLVQKIGMKAMVVVYI